MNRNTSERVLQQRQRRATRVLLIAFTIILFAGLFAQIAMIARLSRQNKDIRNVEAEIKQLGAEADNLNLVLSQLGDLNRVETLATRLGMKKPGEGQIRVVNLPDAVESTSAQSAENTGAEEMRQ